MPKLSISSVMCVLLTLAIIFQAACTDEMRWKEQIYTHDGSLLEVERYATRRSIGFPYAQRGSILTEELRYSKLGVEWRAKNTSEQLVSFDVIDGIPYLVSALTVDKRQYCIGKSTGEYLANFYRWVGGREEKITREQTPVSLMRWNTTGLGHWGDDSRTDPKYLSWQDVMWRTAQSGVPEPLAKFFADDSLLRCN